MKRGEFAGLLLKVSVYDILSPEVACAANHVTLAHADRSLSPLKSPTLAAA